MSFTCLLAKRPLHRHSWWFEGGVESGCDAPIQKQALQDVLQVMLGVKVLDAGDVAGHKRRREDKEKSRKGKKRDKQRDGDRQEKVKAGADDEAAVDMFERVFAAPEPARQDALEEPAAKEHSPSKPLGNHVDPTVPPRGKTTVGDGGASWRMKALKRAQMQAEEQGSSLRDVVSQRWGSVAELATDVDKAAPMGAHRQFSRGMKSKMKRPAASYGSQGDGGHGRSRSQISRDGFWGEGTGEGSMRERSRELGEYDDVVKRAARDMNRFANDGSFMNQFNKSQEAADTPARVDDWTNVEGQAPRKPPVEAEGRAPRAPSRPTSAPSHARNAANISVPRDNNSVAAMLRARLGGKTVQAPATESLGTQEGDREPDQAPATVHLPMVDARGRAAPGAFGRETTAQAHTEPAAEADLDLQTMVRRVKHGTEEGMNDVIARNIAKNSYYRETAADDEYDFDVGTDVLTAQKVSKRGKKAPSAELERKEKARQINEYRRMSKTQNHCRLCLEKNDANAHLTVSMSPSAYLALPDRGRLVPGHCCIVPVEHIASSRLADENTWEELRNFKKCVLQMMQSRGMECIFFETALDVTSTISKHHARIDCVPVSPEVMDKAPMYFKKAIEDATSDWAQHASKGCIETESRHLQRKIPPNFPYVHIEFGLSRGFVSVIDEPREFDRNFCRRVILGLLESSGNSNEREASAMQAKGSREGREVQKAWTNEFKSEYAAFNWVP